MKISALLRRLTLGMVLAFGLSNLYAQSYPSQSLKLVMPFAPELQLKTPCVFLLTSLL